MTHCDESNICHRNACKNACALTAAMPACQQATRAMTLMMTMTPLQCGQQHQLEDGNNAITTRAPTPSRIEGDDTIVTRETLILMTARMPVHRHLQQHHHHEGNNCNGNDGKGPYPLTVTTLS
jgi:hypothetical protein